MASVAAEVNGYFDFNAELAEGEFSRVTIKQDPDGKIHFTARVDSGPDVCLSVERIDLDLALKVLDIKENEPE